MSPYRLPRFSPRLAKRATLRRRLGGWLRGTYRRQRERQACLRLQREEGISREWARDILDLNGQGELKLARFASQLLYFLWRVFW